jgi:hypothetical protein
MLPTIDIVIRSYYRDLQWLNLALGSIERFAVGHRRVVVIVPEATLHRVGLSALPDGINVQLFSCRNYFDDYLGQQITKLHADLYTDADVILHLDSDNVFVSPCDLRQRLFDGDRMRMTFERKAGHEGPDARRDSPIRFLDRPISWDLTAGPPMIAPRYLYSSIRSFCQQAHGMSMTEYAHAASTDRFCEFALLRGFALVRESERYAWLDLAERQLLPECRVFWSRAETPASVADRLPPALAPLTVRGD